MSWLAFAHAGGQAISPMDLWHHWTFDPLVVIPLLLSHWLYGRGLARAWARSPRIIPLWRAACFFAGEVVLVVALISPLDPLGETLLTAHMTQHILLTAVAPPLLVLGLPVRAWTWALPARWRKAAGWPPLRWSARWADRLSAPLMATLVSSAVLALWHAPVLFEAALEQPVVHTLEHLSFFLTALLFWRGVLAKDAPPIAACGMILCALMGSGMLGALLTLSPLPLYDWYGGYAVLWGMDAVTDQQLAGILMWAGGGGIYLSAFAMLALRVVGPAERRSRPSRGIMRASTSSRSMK